MNSLFLSELFSAFERLAYEITQQDSAHQSDTRAEVYGVFLLRRMFLVFIGYRFPVSDE